MTAPSIVEFLTARLDDLERAALRCAEVYPGDWELSDRGWKATVRADGPAFRVVAELDQERAAGLDAGWLGGYLDHIVSHSPALVLADIAAKRKVIELYRYWDGDANDYGQMKQVLHVLAEPFSEHPDYRQEWRLTDG